MNIEDVIHLPVVGGHCPPVRSGDTLGGACGTTGVEDKERVVAWDSNCVMAFCDCSHFLCIVRIQSVIHVMIFIIFPLDNQPLSLRHSRQVKSLVNNRRILQYLIHFNST